MGTLPSGISPVSSGLFDRFFAKIANTASTKEVAATAEMTATITGTLFGLTSALDLGVVGELQSSPVHSGSQMQ